MLASLVFTAALASPLVKRASFTGQANYYGIPGLSTPQLADGICGLQEGADYSADDYLVALGIDVYSDADCGMCVEVSFDGNTAFGIIADVCTTCGNGLNIPVNMFADLVGGDAQAQELGEVTVDYNIVVCPQAIVLVEPVTSVSATESAANTLVATEIIVNTLATASTLAPVNSVATVVAVASATEIPVPVSASISGYAEAITGSITAIDPTPSPSVPSPSVSLPIPSPSVPIAVVATSDAAASSPIVSVGASASPTLPVQVTVTNIAPVATYTDGVPDMYASTVYQGSMLASPSPVAMPSPVNPAGSVQSPNVESETIDSPGAPANPQQSPNAPNDPQSSPEAPVDPQQSPSSPDCIPPVSPASPFDPVLLSNGDKATLASVILMILSLAL